MTLRADMALNYPKLVSMECNKKKGIFMKKRNLIVFLASLSLIFASCNKPGEGGGGGVEPPVVVDKYTVSFDANGGTGTMASTEITAGQYTLPANGFTAPSGKEFAGWKVNGQGDLLQPGAKIYVSANTSLVAQWKDIVIPIHHLDPFVTQVENPSLTRDFNEEFDEMVEDFSSANPSGTLGTGSVFNKSFLRVLVDSENEGEPTTPDAAIYKMATGSYQIQNYEGIGFKMRIVGAGSLQLSNLVLGLRGDDAFKVYEINLGSALNPDGEALSELTHEFADVVVSPGQSIEDANTLYELVAGGNSDVKVLDRILGFHLYALDEECSAIVEIQEVFLVNAGEKTVLDSFDRTSVGQADATCWWRGSTGFIVQKGVTLNNSNYTTKEITLGDYKNLVLTISGDSSEFKVNDKALSTLKDSNDKAVTAAVNGAFYSYVINLEKSSLVPNGGKFVLQSGKELVVSQIFLTNLQDEAPVTDYPKIDTFGASYITDFNFTMAKGTIKTDYDSAVADQRVIDAGLNYVISYHMESELEVNGSDLVIKGGNYDYTNLVIGSNAAVKQYLVLAVKTGYNLNDFRIKLGTSETIYANNWVAAAGLPSIPEAGTNYPYTTESGYQLLIVDLARSGFANVNNEIQMWYTGGEDLTIGALFFADAYTGDAIVTEKELNTFEVAAGEGYAYVGASNVEGLDYVKIETTATPANELRFGVGDQARWMNAGLKDNEGKTIPGDATEFVLDLKANNIVLDNGFFHIHSTKGATAFTIKVSSYIVTEQVEIVTNEVLNETVAAGEGYAYVGAANVGDAKLVKVETTATPANELRFGVGDQAKWMNAGLKDKDGNTIPGDATEFILDLDANGIVLDNGFMHVHGTKGEAAFTIKVSTYKELPVMITKAVSEEVTKEVAAGEGYAYVGGCNAEGATAILVKTNATPTNELRFGVGDQARWMNAGLKDIFGDTIPGDATEFYLDLAANNIVLDNNFFHIHSTKGATAFSITVQPVVAYEAGSYAHILSGFIG